jgi:hypothetical protein
VTACGCSRCRKWLLPGTSSNRYGPAKCRAWSCITSARLSSAPHRARVGTTIGRPAAFTAGQSILALQHLLYGLPLAAGFLPGSLAANVTKFLPATAGQAVAAVQPDPILLSPGPGSPCSAASPRSCWPWPPRGCAEAAPRPRTLRWIPGSTSLWGVRRHPSGG